jgi:hypothetical protein
VQGPERGAGGPDALEIVDEHHSRVGFEAAARTMRHVEALFDELLARWVLDDLPPEAVPALAVDALTKGCAATELAVLAVLSRPTRREVEDELTPLLARLRVTRPARLAALKTVADACARRMVDGTISPSEGAHRLWLWADEVYGQRELFELAIFVGLASEWDDHERYRAEYETEMIEGATKLLAAGGLRVS